jgi:uncharacterized protein
MDARAVVDTGFLIALLNKRDKHHEWAIGLLPSLRGPWLTAEACVSETLFLLESAGREAVERLLGWFDQELVLSQHFIPERFEAVRKELLGYRRRWVDLADACLLVASDLNPRLPLVTVDAKDFAVFFRHRSGRRLLVP